MNILVTAIGSFSADCVIGNLKKAGHRVIGCDIYPSTWHAASKDCGRVYQVPFSTDEDEYVSSLLNICEKEQIEYVFPLTDLEVDVLNKYRCEFHDAGVVLCIQSEFATSIARDKLAMHEFFSNDPAVNLPFSVPTSNLTKNFPLPAIAKPINGRSSQGLMKLNNEDELHWVQNRPSYIIQEVLDGPIFTVDYVRDSQENDFAIPREELLRTKHGAGTTVRITPDKILQKTASHIGNKLNIAGCINMEFIFHNGKYSLIDINPRFSAGIAFSHFIGYNMVLSHFNSFTNKPILPPIMIEEQIICKRYNEELLWKP